METATPPHKPLKLPVLLSLISAGFPSPASDYIETFQSIEDMLIKRPSATHWVKAIGNSMEPGILDKDFLAIDFSLKPSVSGEIVVAIVNGEHVVKRFRRRGRKGFLAADNRAYPEIEVTEDVEIIAVVMGQLRVTCRR